MIRAFVTFCLIANPYLCEAPVEIMPHDGRPITTPIDCMIGGIIYFAQGRIQQKTPDAAQPAPIWFAKVNCRMEGDGSDIVRQWVEDQRAKAVRLEPQIK